MSLYVADPTEGLSKLPQMSEFLGDKKEQMFGTLYALYTRNGFCALSPHVHSSLHDTCGYLRAHMDQMWSSVQ